MITAYYNEIDSKAAAWLRQLIKNGNITPGEVDERSITEISPNDLVGFDRVHFFAGVGTWDYVLNQAGWGDKPIWTASLPCQPFSAAGKGLGKDDERHLLPHFLNLVRECKPHTIAGEQVATAITHGWLDDLQTNMEAEGYAIGHCVLGAHSVGSPHRRQRLYWLADNRSERHQEQPGIRRIPREENGYESRKNSAGGGGLGIADSAGSQPGIETTKAARHGNSIEPASSVIGLGDTEHDGRIASEIKRSDGAAICDSQAGTDSTGESEGTSASESLSWIYCRDNKYRPIKSSIQPLAHGLTKGMVYSSDPGEQIDANATQEARVMRLKGYGNAIQAQTAMAFIKAYMSI